MVDECSQDWTLVSAEVGSDGLVFEAVRPLETTDPQDRVLVDDTVEGKCSMFVVLLRKGF